MTDRRAFYDERARYRPAEIKRGYNQLLRQLFGFVVPPGLRVLEIGCGIGDLLAAVRPSRGVGIDFSAEMVALARSRHPDLEFHVSDAAEFSSAEPFDYILMSDLVNDLEDVQQILTRAQQWAHPRTRLV